MLPVTAFPVVCWANSRSMCIFALKSSMESMSILGYQKLWLLIRTGHNANRFQSGAGAKYSTMKTNIDAFYKDGKRDVSSIFLA